MDAGSKEALSVSPNPSPCVQDGPVVLDYLSPRIEVLPFWPYGWVSFLSEKEDWTRLRLLEQVRYPVCMEARMR